MDSIGVRKPCTAKACDWLVPGLEKGLARQQFMVITGQISAQSNCFSWLHRNTSHVNENLDFYLEFLYLY
ncbi:hypothetical protein XENTR_v10016767 [Xenopus tropicalis]|nr:hypothetical protein XENTR_v10016767 [Xenopus tropicalis]